jgi:decaprenylphospho-beta-D-ribofuranose 2-oxidase
LDRIPGWNRLYGKRGFLQYQFVVPDDEPDTVVAVAERVARAGVPVALAVLKRMGPSAGGPLSFPMPGWTLALDLPLGDPSLSSILDECDDDVAGAGGKVYLAKDSRLRAGVAREMYRMLPAWREVRSSLDPHQRLRSNLSQRLGLID